MSLNQIKSFVTSNLGRITVLALIVSVAAVFIQFVLFPHASSSKINIRPYEANITALKYEHLSAYDALINAEKQTNAANSKGEVTDFGEIYNEAKKYAVKVEILNGRLLALQNLSIAMTEDFIKLPLDNNNEIGKTFVNNLKNSHSSYIRLVSQEIKRYDFEASLVTLKQIDELIKEAEASIEKQLESEQQSPSNLIDSEKTQRENGRSIVRASLAPPPTAEQLKRIAKIFFESVEGMLKSYSILAEAYNQEIESQKKWQRWLTFFLLIAGPILGFLTKVEESNQANH
jgi:hypothetical protein